MNNSKMLNCNYPINRKSSFFICAVFSGLMMVPMFSVCQNNKITGKNIKFIEYPGFPEAHSSWGSIGYNDANNSVHIGVTNHKDKVALYEYDVADGSVKLNGFINDMAHLRPFQWQGKIHSKIISDPKGNIYFTTDGGESRQEYLMNNPNGYAGGFFMKWNPKTDIFTNLGMGLQYESLKDIEIDTETGIIYAVSYPQAHFLVYDPDKNVLNDLGRLASAHVPRILFTDWWGNCYYVDWRQRLVKYEKNTRKLVFARESLPAFEGTPGSKIITGITSFAKDDENGIIYLITYGAKVLAFQPRENGIGEVKDLGGVYDTGSSEPWRPYVPNLNFGNNGKLYYFIGGHGNYIRNEKTVLVELDPGSGHRTIIYEYPLDELTEVTGSDVKDKEGNLYFAARKRVAKSTNASASEDGTSSPFMILFNPEKEVKK